MQQKKSFVLTPFKDMEISIHELKTILNRVVTRRELHYDLNNLYLYIPFILLYAAFHC